MKHPNMSRKEDDLLRASPRLLLQDKQLTAPDGKELFVQGYCFCQWRTVNNKLPFVKTLIFVKIFLKVFIWGEPEVGSMHRVWPFCVSRVVGRISKQTPLLAPLPSVAGVLTSLPFRLSLASFGGKHSVHKHENKPIIDPWTEFVQVWRAPCVK